MSIDGVGWCLLSKAEQESLLASGDYAAERCRYCEMAIEVWQREDAAAAEDWQRLPPALLTLFTRNPADWRVIVSLRGLPCPKGGEHSKHRGDQRAYATIITTMNGMVGRNVGGGVHRG